MLQEEIGGKWTEHVFPWRRSGFTADESSSFQDASVGADEGFSLESDASGLAADARPAEASDM